jgi:hypothetical protein
MSDLMGNILGALTLLNRIAVTGILITAFALIIYIGLYNRRSRIARAFAGLLFCAIGTYLGDLLAQISTPPPFLWLRVQWIGIALMPAAALDLSDTLLSATGDISPTRRAAARAGYAVGLAVFLLVALTGWVATPGIADTHLPHLAPGPLFFPFTLYYFGSLGWAAYNVIEARRRSLTATSRRRMTYFALAFPAPALGTFPFLLPGGWPVELPAVAPWAGILLVNLGVGAALTLMGYTVAYFGASAPDRVIKRRLIKYLIRGPILAALVITALVLSTRIEKWFGLPGEIVGLVAAATIILLIQLFIVTLQPTLDRLIAGDDASEVSRLQQFSERLMTVSDLTQFLENILAALCDLLRARVAFIMQIAPGKGDPVLVAIGGVDLSALVPPEAVRSVVHGRPAGNGLNGANGHAGANGLNGASSAAAPAVQPQFAAQTGDAPGADGEAERRDGAAEPGGDAVSALEEGGAIERSFIQWNGYWLIPLRARDADSSGAPPVLGVAGLVARASEPELTDEERRGVRVLVTQAARALEDAIKQQRAFEALERIIPEADDMQRRMAETRNPAAPTISDFELATEGGDDFTHLVRDALSQYWGGPKLTNSPLMNLKVVTDAMEAHNGNATKALRAVLTEAIERQKPDGARSLTAAEWLLYNILEMKIIQGQRVRDVARKLVMSESDLYRKQRAAFEEVARTVMEMEREAREREAREREAREREPDRRPAPENE